MKKLLLVFITLLLLSCTSKKNEFALFKDKPFNPFNVPIVCLDSIIANRDRSFKVWDKEMVRTSNDLDSILIKCRKINKDLDNLINKMI